MQEHRGLLSVRYPMEHGIVKDWNDMERIWQYVYSKEQLQTFSEEVWIEFIFILIVLIFTRIILVSFELASIFSYLNWLYLIIVWIINNY